MRIWPLRPSRKANWIISSSRRARQWVQELNFENVQRGLVQKRKIFNSAPQGIQGFAFNARQAPFNDVRMRKAFTLLMDRQRMIEKLMFNQYLPQDSYFPGGSLRKSRQSQERLRSTGCAGVAGSTRLDGAQFARASCQETVSRSRLRMLYDQQTFEPYLTIYQEDLRKAGITLNLRLITHEQQFQMVSQRKFQMALQAWGAGGLFLGPGVDVALLPCRPGQ